MVKLYTSCQCLLGDIHTFDNITSITVSAFICISIMFRSVDFLSKKTFEKFIMDPL